LPVPVTPNAVRKGQFAEAHEIERFRAEASAVAQLDHPGIVPIYEVGEQQGFHFYSMAFIDGRSLADRIAEGLLPPRESAYLVGKIADALHYAHQKGVIHRDIKPANILIDDQGQP
jgi:eukaryotic-like serine/threonine-protein kinase